MGKMEGTIQCRDGKFHKRFVVEFPDDIGALQYVDCEKDAVVPSEIQKLLHNLGIQLGVSLKIHDGTIKTKVSKYTSTTTDVEGG